MLNEERRIANDGRGQEVPEGKVFVGGLPPTTTDQDLTDFFSSFGPVDSVVGCCRALFWYEMFPALTLGNRVILLVRTHFVSEENFRQRTALIHRPGCREAQSDTSDRYVPLALIISRTLERRCGPHPSE